MNTQMKLFYTDIDVDEAAQIVDTPSSPKELVQMIDALDETIDSITGLHPCIDMEMLSKAIRAKQIKTKCQQKLREKGPIYDYC